MNTGNLYTKQKSKFCAINDKVNQTGQMKYVHTNFCFKNRHFYKNIDRGKILLLSKQTKC